MKRFILSFAASVLMLTGAFAADLPSLITKGPRAQPVAVYSWEGVYAGLNGGGAWGDINTTKNSMTTSGALVGIPAGTFSPASTFLGSDSAASVSGATVGGFAGYNYQLGRVVLGIESDFAWSNIKTSSAFSGSPLGPQYTTSTKGDMFGTTRARIGYAFDNVLVYGTGGIGYGHFKSSLGILPGPKGAPTGPQYSASDSAWLTGAAYGAGVDWMVAPNWIVGVEYLRIDYGKSGHNFDFKAAGSAHADADVAMNIVRAKVGYKF